MASSDNIRRLFSGYLVSNMKNVFLAACAALVFITACNTQKDAASSKAQPTVQKSPFPLSVVPETSYGERFGSSIDMAHDKPRDFYVVSLRRRRPGGNTGIAGATERFRSLFLGGQKCSR
jgi:hypothetical protein